MAESVTYKHKESGLTETVEPGTGYDDHFRSSPDWESSEGSGEPTKDELLERAAELEIDGRSSMNKAELVEAIEEAENE